MGNSDAQFKKQRARTPWVAFLCVTDFELVCILWLEGFQGFILQNEGQAGVLCTQADLGKAMTGTLPACLILTK